jgi:ribosomal protein S18 acetylase RimI-like enzyme
MALDAVARERRYLMMTEAPPLERLQKFVADVVKRDLPQFVAVKGENIVGWCDALPGNASYGTGHVGYLGMGLLPEYRGKGIGSQLVEATIRKARELSFEKIELSVYASNVPAISLYRKLGFVEEGRKKRSRLLDGVYDDVILMAFEL